MVAGAQGSQSSQPGTGKPPWKTGCTASMDGVRARGFFLYLQGRVQISSLHTSLQVDGRWQRLWAQGFWIPCPPILVLRASQALDSSQHNHLAAGPVPALHPEPAVAVPASGRVSSPCLLCVTQGWMQGWGVISEKPKWAGRG